MITKTEPPEDIFIPIDELDALPSPDEPKKPNLEIWTEELNKENLPEKNRSLIHNIMLDILPLSKIEQEGWLLKIKKNTGYKINTLKEQFEKTKKYYVEKNTYIQKSKKKNIDSRFYNPELIKHIHTELDTNHKLDHYEKLGVFIVRVSAELKTPADRVSCALKGDSSAGKDNIVKTALGLFPAEDNFILTRGTQSALEEEANKVKAIAFSEINANREDGANASLTEVFKQLSEGGTSVIKRDQNTHEVIKIECEQKTLLYGTTETESDDELMTRYVVIPIKSDSYKNKVVVSSVLKNVSNPEFYLNKTEKENWVASGIRLLDHDIEIIIPYAELLNKEIETEDGRKEPFFDYTKERIKRDVKRLLSLTKSIAWLYQKQRHIKNIEGKKFLFAEPSDFITAYKIFGGFFALTYSGLDFRLQKCLETIKKLESKHDAEILALGFDSQYYGWVLRKPLMKELGIHSVNTIKKYINSLKDFQLIETHFDGSFPKGYLIRTLSEDERGVSNGCQMGIKGYQLTAIDTLLIPYLTPLNIKEIYNEKEISLIDLSFIDDKLKNIP